MIIKSVTSKGDAVPMTAEEAIKPALVAAIKTQNTLDYIYWLDMTNLKISSSHSMADKDGVWEAWAQGEVLVGKTRAKDDAFFQAKPHSFDVHYKLGKNDLGMPEVVIVTMKIELLSTNPAQVAADLVHNLVPKADPRRAPSTAMDEDDSGKK